MTRLRIVGLLAAALAVAAVALSVAVPAASAIPGGINGAGLKPSMGWSSWSFLRMAPTAAKMEAQADAMVSSGLAAVGYKYVNLDDFYYTYPADDPGDQGMNVDKYGRWVTDPVAFPPGSNGEDGMKVLADYIHSKGLKFGIYLTPGIPRQAVLQNTPIEGTSYRADDIVLTPYFTEYNYNQGVMYRIDFSKPAAQEYYNSIANRFASWGVDYLKFDGIRNYTSPTSQGNVPDIIAMSKALQQTGRPIVFDTTQGNQAIGIAPFCQQWANQTVFFPDIENGATSPALTSWSDVSNRFDAVSQYAPFVGPGFHMDCDSVEVGSGGAIDGLTPDERMTMMSLWSLESSAWILGPDMTNLDPYDLSLLTNKDVIAVDQDDIAATQIYNSGNGRVFAKMETNGDAIVGLFNTGAQAQVVSTTASAVGLPGGYTDYLLNDLWSHQKTETAGVISATVPSHGVAYYRVTPINNPTVAPPCTTLGISGLSGILTPGQAVTATVSFTDNGVLPAQHPKITFMASSGWTVTQISGKLPGAVESGQTVQATFTVVPPTGTDSTGTVNASVTYSWPGQTAQSRTVTLTVTAAFPVKVNELRLRTTTNSTNQFVELFNAYSAPVDIGGWTVVYRSRTGSTDTTMATIPAGTMIPAGGFYLLGRSGNGTTTGYVGPPTADQTFTTSLNTTSGAGVGIRDTIGILVDSVRYGTATNALVEGSPAPLPPNTADPGSSIVRLPDGHDTDNNATDFTVTSTPTPGGPNR
jgi:hypothetical protein